MSTKEEKKAIPAKEKKELSKKDKTIQLIRKIIYIVLFSAIIGCFIYLSNKYSNEEPETKKISDYYEIEDTSMYQVINGSEMINKIKKGTNIIFIGSETSDWSKKYIEIITPIFKTFDIETVYYYDLNNDKAQKNSNYYDIKELLKGSLTTTDGSKSNLLAPSLYIIDNGEVKYYNTETVAMRNTTTPNSYWNEERKKNFKIELEDALLNYYLNNTK